MRLIRHIVFIILLFMAQPLAAGVEVIINGVGEKLEDNLRIALSLERQKDHEKLTAASIRSLYERSAGEINLSLRSHGYYNATVRKSLREIGDAWVASFDIDPGRQVLVRQVKLAVEGDGRQDEVLQEAVADFPLQQGSQLDHAKYEAGKRKLENLARRRGYFEAEWLRHRLEIDTGNHSADIDLVFASGPRYRYGSIDIPPTVILPGILDEVLVMRAGAFYDADDLIKTQQELQNTNYFSQVEVIPGQADEAGKVLPVSIRLVARNKNAYRVGLGFGTDTGPRLVGAWDSNYLNRLGHRLENDLKLSPVQSALSSSYLIPFFRSSENEVGITAAVSREDTDTRVSNKFESSVQHLSSRWGWHETISLSYQFEDFTVADTRGSSHLLIPGLSYWKSVSDDPIYSRRGYRLSADLRGSGKGFISDVSFLQLTLRGKTIFPLGEDGRLIARAELGGTVTSSFTKLPSSLRFFAGGDNSIRGFDLEALGPRNTQGEIIGGKYLAVGSVEYEQRVYKKWSVAVFSDFGNAFDSFSTDFAYSVGTGIRWLSPVGLIRLDVASGISDSDYPLRLHIIIGPDL